VPGFSLPVSDLARSFCVLFYFSISLILIFPVLFCFGGVIHFCFVIFPRISAGAGTLTPLAPITLQEMKLDPSMAAYQQGKLRVNEV
jgi:hypothetical protein